MHERRILQQQEEMAHREQQVERERQHQHREQYQSAPHQSNTGAIPIHQPVASRLPGAMHSPGGLLANHGGIPPAGPLGAPTGPGNAFGGPLHTDASRTMQQLTQQTNNHPQHQMFGSSLLNHSNAAAGLGAMNGPPAVFGGPLHANSTPAPVQIAGPFSGAPVNGHQAPGAPALNQGQQPILNVSQTLSFTVSFCRFWILTTGSTGCA